MRNTARLFLATVLFAILTATSAFADCPASLPANTVMGRLAIPAAGGGCQAIPFANLVTSLIGSQSSNVLAYGAVAGDSTKSATNVTAIRASCTATSNVYIPVGTFYVDAFTWPENCNVLGAGKNLSTLRQPDGQGVGTSSFIQTPTTTGWVAQDITFRSAYLVNGAANTVYSLFASNVRLENVDIYAGVACWGIDGSDHITGVNVGCRRYTGRGISSNNPSSYVTLVNPQIEGCVGCDQGIYFLAGSYIQVRGGYIKLPGSWGMLFGYNDVTFPGVFPHDIIVDGIQIDTAGVEPIGVQNGYNLTIINNQLVGDPNSLDNGIGVYANDAVTTPTLITANIVIANNTLRNIGGSGIIVNIAGFATRVAITGNVVINPGFSASHFESDGIAVVSGQQNGANTVTVTGNMVVDQYAATSSSAAVAIGTGAKTLTTPAGQVWIAGNTLRLADQANAANWMQGTVTSYSGTTLVMSITSINGSGTPASWLIGHARSMIAEYVGGDTSGTFTALNNFEGNNVAGGWAGPTALGGYFIAGATSRAVNGGVLIQGKGDTQKGWRTVNNAGSNYWDTFLDGSSTFVFRNANGNTFNVDTTGNVSYSGDLYLHGNHFTSGSTAFTWTMPAATSAIAGLSVAQTWLATQTFPSPVFTGTVSGANTIPLSVLAQIGANSVAANCTAGTAGVTAVQAGAADQVFRVGGGSNPCAFGSIDLSKSNAVGATILGSSNGGAGAVSGIMKANGSGTVSAAVANTDYISTTNKSALVVDVNRSGNQTPAAGSFVKVQLNNKVTDPNTWFDATTNFRFQPNVAGVFMITGSLNMNVGAASYGGVGLYKNGTEYNKFIMDSTNANSWQLSVPAIVSMNGTTDFVELFGFSSGGTPLFTAGTQVTKMQVYQLF